MLAPLLATLVASFIKDPRCKNLVSIRRYINSMSIGAITNAATQQVFCESGFQSLKFDNRNIRSLPVDRSGDNRSRQVKDSIFSLVTPTPVKDPQVVALSTDALKLIGLQVSDITNAEVAKYLSGNEILRGSEPAAHCYCGHQFGSFAGQLGDGAAIALGEVINPEGVRWEVQLKGAGLTPYSRTADGRKVLRSSIREFLCSEAMHFLGIPTTRALACVTSESTTQRDPLYDGTVIDEKCTIVTRLAPNFFRFGSFEIFKHASDGPGERAGDIL